MKKITFMAIILALFSCAPNKKEKVHTTSGVITKIEITNTEVVTHSINDYCTIKPNGFEKGTLLISHACENGKRYEKRTKIVKYTVLFFDSKNVKYREELEAKTKNNWTEYLQEELPLSEVGKKLSIFTGDAEEMKTGCNVKVFYRSSSANNTYLAPPVVDASMCDKLSAPKTPLLPEAPAK